MNKIMKTLPLTVGWILVYVVVILAVFIALDARIQVLRLQKLVGTPSVETPSTNLIPQQEQLKKLS